MSSKTHFCETPPTAATRTPSPNHRVRTEHKRSRALSPPDPKTWDDVNQRLGYLGEIDRQLHVLHDEFEQKVAVLRQQWLEASRPIEKERDRIQSQVERFYWARRDELVVQGRKSVELAFGRLGSRLSRSVVVEDAALAQQWLEAHGLERFLRTRTEVDREAIRSTLLSSSGFGTSVSHALMACPAVRFEESEQFWCTLRQSPADGVPPGRRGHWRHNSPAEKHSDGSESGQRRSRTFDRTPVIPESIAAGGTRDQAVQ